MPGIDEEIAYRGIMLGLLTKILKSKNLKKENFTNDMVNISNDQET